MVHMTLYEKLKTFFREYLDKGDRQEHNATVGLRSCIGIGAAAACAQAAAVVVSHPLYVSIFLFLLCYTGVG